jgi:diguanylate cyclase (GGDEF)-like protein/PAS domain S-box-containing protein
MNESGTALAVRLDDIFDMYVTTVDGHIVDIGESLARLLGYGSTDDMVRRMHEGAQRLYLDDRVRGQLLAKIAEDPSAEIFRLETSVKRKDGSSLPVVETFRVIRDKAGKAQFFAGMFFKVSANDRDDDLAEQANDFVLRTMSDSKTGMFVASERKFVYVNDSFARMCGAEPDRLLGTDWLEVFPAPVDEYAGQAPETGRTVERFNVPLYAKRHGVGRDCPLWTSVTLSLTVLRHNGQRLVMGSTVASQSATSVVSEASPLWDNPMVGVFGLTSDLKIVMANDACAKILGFPDSEALISTADFSQIFSDQAGRTEYLSRLAATDRCYATEQPVRTRSGETAWIVETGRWVDGRAEGRIYLGFMFDITAKRRAGEELAYRATHDVLTGLANRSQTLSFLARCERSMPCAVLFIDLDGFKYINDLYGHGIGDAVLRVVAERFSGCERAAARSLLARHGGDEFCAVLEGTDLPGAARYARSLLASLADPIRIGEIEVFVSASIGIACDSGDEEGRPAESMLHNADIAMYEAKRAGKNSYSIYAQVMKERWQRRVSTERELRHAIARGEFRLVYQPLWDLNKRRYAGVEALLRWQHPCRGLVAPAGFIHVAEESGLMIDIGAWVLTEAATVMNRVRSLHPLARDMTLSVNVANCQFSSPSFASVLAQALRQSGLPASGLHLEITEDVLIRDIDAGRQRMRQLKDMGVGLHMDDFGTGYSSLRYLTELDFDMVKLDSSFTYALHDERKRRTVRLIGELANVHGMDMVAEGIETREQHDAVSELGFSWAQGFYYSNLLNREEFETWVIGGLRGIPELSAANS